MRFMTVDPAHDHPLKAQPWPHRARFAVLTIQGYSSRVGYVIFDRATSQITDGVYFSRTLALEVAAHCNHRGSAPPDMTPNAEALGLLFPVADCLGDGKPQTE